MHKKILEKKTLKKCASRLFWNFTRLTSFQPKTVLCAILQLSRFFAPFKINRSRYLLDSETFSTLDQCLVAEQLCPFVFPTFPNGASCSSINVNFRPSDEKFNGFGPKLAPPSPRLHLFTVPFTFWRWTIKKKERKIKDWFPVSRVQARFLCS